MKKVHLVLILLIASNCFANAQNISHLEKSYAFKDILFCMHKAGINYKINKCEEVKGEKVSLCSFKHPSYNSYGGVKLDDAQVMISGQLVRGFKLTMVDKSGKGEDDRAKKMLRLLQTLYGKPTSTVNENTLEWNGDQVGISYFLKKGTSDKGAITSVVYLYHMSYKKYFTKMP